MLESAKLNIIQTLIQSGVGTGPMMPSNRRLISRGANSSGMKVLKDEGGKLLLISSLFLIERGFCFKKMQGKTMISEYKLVRLKENLGRLDGLIFAFSGGVGNAFLLQKEAFNTLPMDPVWMTSVITGLEWKRHGSWECPVLCVKQTSQIGNP